MNWIYCRTFKVFSFVLESLTPCPFMFSIVLFVSLIPLHLFVYLYTCMFFLSCFCNSPYHICNKAICCGLFTFNASASDDVVVVKNRAVYFFQWLHVLFGLLNIYFWIRIKISDGNLLFFSHTNVSVNNFWYCRRFQRGSLF